MLSVMRRQMELRRLRYFIAVAEELSLTKSAQNLRLSRPSLARQVRNLEDEIGVRLLDRLNNRVSLTNEGRAFLFDPKKLLATCAESIANLKGINRGERSQLNIGCVANIHHEQITSRLQKRRACRSSIFVLGRRGESCYWYCHAHVHCGRSPRSQPVGFPRIRRDGARGLQPRVRGHGHGLAAPGSETPARSQPCRPLRGLDSRRQFARRRIHGQSRQPRLPGTPRTRE